MCCDCVYAIHRNLCKHQTIIVECNIKYLWHVVQVEYKIVCEGLVEIVKVKSLSRVKMSKN